jgi:hypothetical protein
MVQTQYFAIANQQVSLMRVGVLKLEGYFNGGATAYLQIFDSCTAPAAGAVPVRQEVIFGTAPFYFEFKNGEMRTTEGLFIGVSSTDGTWTASASTMDLAVETDGPLFVGHIVGDKTTARNTLQVWSQTPDATAVTKLLHGLIIKELLGAARYIMIFADDAKVTNPLLIYPIAASSTNYLFFDGVLPVSLGAAAPNSAGVFVLNGVTYHGCTVVVADSMNVTESEGGTRAVVNWTYGTTPTVTANSANILAITN